MNNNKRYSFFQLFSKGTDSHPGNYKLVIPIIQRDYAQGRNNEKAKEVRNEFLSQLFEYMTAEDDCHDLDFVYGITSSATDASKRKEFIPLDGQQRLTTLFIIHLYLAIRCKDTDEAKRFFKAMRTTNGRLVESVFSYRTRSSAVEFCNELVDQENNIDEFFTLNEEEVKKYNNRISEFIYNASWFYPDWKQDPTVEGMLTMIDAVNEKFNHCDHQQILSRLLSKDNPSVGFIFMNLKDYKLTDDLYIKMNSRGKPLTSFENFKAKYEQYVSSLEKGMIVTDSEEKDIEKFKYLVGDNGETLKVNRRLWEMKTALSASDNKTINTVKDYFAFNIDTKWSELFWKYSVGEIKEFKKREEEKNEDNRNDKTLDKLLEETLDSKISRFIKMVLVNQFAVENSVGKIAIPDELTGSKSLSFTNLEEIGAISADGVVFLTQVFDLFSDRPLIIMPGWAHRYYDEKEVFKSMIMGKDFSMTKRLMMFAYIKFRLIFGDNHPYDLVEWMRFIYNITLDDNTIQDITKNTYHRAVSAIMELIYSMKGSETSSISRLLACTSLKSKPDFFPEYQFAEEIIKSRLFLMDEKNALHSESDPILSEENSNGDSWGKTILQLEAHPYFTGQIGFLFRMSGIYQEFLENESIEWPTLKEHHYKSELKKYGSLASTVFEGGYSNRLLAKDSLFERVMLALHPEYLKDHLLNSTKKSVGSNNLLRDRSWKTYLRLSEDKFDKMDMVKDVFDRLDVNNPVESLRNIVSSGCEGPLWKRDLVNYDYLMGKSNNGFFRESEDGHKVLCNSIYFSMWDHEVYSFVLFWEYLTDKGTVYSMSPFELAYCFSNSGYEVPYIKLSFGDYILKVKSEVRKEDGELKNHYFEMDSFGNSELEEFLTGKGFSRINENSTVFRLIVEDWNPNNPEGLYREAVKKKIIDFSKDFSTSIVVKVAES